MAPLEIRFHSCCVHYTVNIIFFYIKSFPHPCILHTQTLRGSTIQVCGSGVVEWISQRTYDHKVPGSNPVHSTSILRRDVNLQFAVLDPSEVNGYR